MSDKEHSPYVVTATGKLYCFKDGCDWTAPGGSEDAKWSWDRHVADSRDTPK